MIELRQEREAMREAELIHAQSRYPISFTLITAVILLLVGVVAVSSMIFNIGPFNDGAP